MSENEQLSIDDLDYMTMKNGRVVPAPAWIHKERCENCVLWERLPKEDQPPDGWGIKGLCKFIHERQQGYQRTSSTDYCQEFKEYGKI